MPAELTRGLTVRTVRRALGTGAALASAFVGLAATASPAAALVSPIAPRPLLQDVTVTHASAPSTGHLLTRAGRTTPTLVPMTPRKGHTLYINLGTTPPASDLPAIARDYTVAILNPWDVETKNKLKALNPALVVLCYKDLASMRRDAVNPDGTDLVRGSSGVGWNEALAHGETWFAHKARTTNGTDGQRVEWAYYGNQFQAGLWEPGYQKQWVQNVYSAVVNDGWDGVEVDNFMYNLGYYYGYQTPEEPGWTVEKGDLGATNAAIVAAEYQVADALGPLLQKQGKLLIGNISDGRNDLERWRRLTQYGGGMEENYTHFAANDQDDPYGYIFDWGAYHPTSCSGSGERPHGWRGQACQVPMLAASNGLFLGLTTARPADDKAALFGLASFWVTGGGHGAYTALPRNQYTGLNLRTEQTLDLGTAQTSDMVQSGGAYTRSFTKGWAAVNPSRDPVTVTIPDGVTSWNGAIVPGRYTMPSMTGLVLYKP